MTEQAHEVSRRHHRLMRRLSKMNLPTMLGLVIFVACLIVAAGYLFYERDSNRKYDIARPGQNEDNQVLNVEDEGADTTSLVTPSAAKQKLRNFEKELEALNGLSSFEPDDLSDQSLQLVPPDQPSL